MSARRPRPGENPTDAPSRALAGLAVAAALCLAGCGFQLRGTAALPFDQVYIELPDGEPLKRELTVLVGANGAVVADSPAGAARLQFGRNSLTRRIQSVGANARVREFELVYELSFSLQDASGAALLERADLEMRRDYSFDQAQVLGAASEEEYLRDEMTREMAARILRRIEATGP